MSELWPKSSPAFESLQLWAGVDRPIEHSFPRYLGWNTVVKRRKAVLKQDRLPIIAACDGCAACCMLVGSPPFLSDEWSRVRLRLPENLRVELNAYRANALSRLWKNQAVDGEPCIWLDLKTRKCIHYDLRPIVCRSFEVGGNDCHDHRKQRGPDLVTWQEGLGSAGR